MGKDSSISWCHHTHNCWWGCWKISPGCTNCYAATFDRRVHGKDTDHWDRTGSRRFMTEDYWKQPLKWNRAAEKRGARERVFCGSMCDWTEQHPDPETNRIMDGYRKKLFELIRATPWLDWLLLTKRIENAAQYLPWVADGSVPWTNVWLGTTAEDQEHADERLPILLDIPAAIHWVSLEPLLGGIDLTRIRAQSMHGFNALDGLTNYPVRVAYKNHVRWVVAGAESGHHARECKISWLRSLRDQCADAGTKFLLKQAVWQQPITIGLGSRTKGKGYARGDMLELPYLDGKQHEEYPEVEHAA